MLPVPTVSGGWRGLSRSGRSSAAELEREFEGALFLLRLRQRVDLAGLPVLITTLHLLLLIGLGIVVSVLLLLLRLLLLRLRLLEQVRRHRLPRTSGSGQRLVLCGLLLPLLLLLLLPLLLLLLLFVVDHC